MRLFLIPVLIFILLSAGDSQSQESRDYYERGVRKTENNNLKGAIIDFTKAIELDTNFQVAYYNRGYAYLFSGETEKAKSDFNTSLKLNPVNAYLLRNLGHYYYAVKDFEKAKEKWEKAVRWISNSKKNSENI